LRPVFIYKYDRIRHKRDYEFFETFNKDGVELEKEFKKDELGAKGREELIRILKDPLRRKSSVIRSLRLECVDRKMFFNQDSFGTNAIDPRFGVVEQDEEHESGSAKGSGKGSDKGSDKGKGSKKND
jgi:hypothetical protein